MTDLGATIAPKSSQLNADDLTAGPMTVTITKVSANEGSPEQPVAVSFEGDGGRPYYPCKTVRRIMVQLWGRDGADYVGRSMTLYRDPEVLWGGMKVGGIRISHMSHIDKEEVVVVTATRANRKPFTVRPLKVEKPRAEQPAPEQPAVPTVEFKSPKDGKTYRSKLPKAIAAIEAMGNEFATTGDVGMLEELWKGNRTWLTELTPETGDILTSEIRRLEEA
jgi:hypothetical protein